MTTTTNVQRIVYYALVLVSLFLFIGFETGFGGMQSKRGISAAIAIIAFIKARYVVLDFMELRGTKIMRLFDAWLLLACTVCVLLILR